MPALPYPNHYPNITMKFRNLNDLEEVTRQSTSRYEFFALEYDRETDELDEDGQPVRESVVPWIEVRPVGELNRPYINAVLASQSKARRRISKGKIDVRMLEDNREQDRDLYPRHVFTGRWGGWLDDATGEEVPYSAEAARELLEQLPIDEFDELRAYCNELGNFRR